jgi:hypothetical protein
MLALTMPRLACIAIRRHARPAQLRRKALASEEARQSHRSTARPRGRKLAPIKSKKLQLRAAKKLQSE